MASTQGSRDQPSSPANGSKTNWKNPEKLRRLAVVCRQARAVASGPELHDKWEELYPDDQAPTGKALTLFVDKLRTETDAQITVRSSGPRSGGKTTGRQYAISKAGPSTPTCRGIKTSKKHFDEDDDEDDMHWSSNVLKSEDDDDSASIADSPLSGRGLAYFNATREMLPRQKKANMRYRELAGEDRDGEDSDREQVKPRSVKEETVGVKVEDDTDMEDDIVVVRPSNSQSSNSDATVASTGSFTNSYLAGKRAATAPAAKLHDTARLRHRIGESANSKQAAAAFRSVVGRKGVGKH